MSPCTNSKHSLIAAGTGASAIRISWLRPFSVVWIPRISRHVASSDIDCKTWHVYFFSRRVQFYPIPLFLHVYINMISYCVYMCKNNDKTMLFAMLLPYKMPWRTTKFQLLIKPIGLSATDMTPRSLYCCHPALSTISFVLSKRLYCYTCTSSNGGKWRVRLCIVLLPRS